MNKEMIFEPDRINTILNALDVYKARGIENIMEFQRVMAIKKFLEKVLDYKEKEKK